MGLRVSMCAMWVQFLWRPGEGTRPQGQELQVAVSCLMWVLGLFKINKDSDSSLHPTPVDYKTNQIIYIYVLGLGCMTHSAPIDVRGQREGVGSLLLLCGF